MSREGAGFTGAEPQNYDRVAPFAMPHARRPFSRLLVTLSVLLLPGVARAQTTGQTPRQTLTGVVVRVSDGDTLLLMSGDATYAVRIFGIDAPEHGQPGHAEAKEALSRHVHAKPASAAVVDRDRHGRIVARVTVNGVDAGKALVGEGWAWHYRHYAADAGLAEAERTARRLRIGVWAQTAPVPPWQYRHQMSSARPGADAPAVAFRGNSKRKVYHAPGCEHFDCLNCVVGFRTREEAEQGGFRPHRSCVR